jgi:hypothetical protein
MNHREVKGTLAVQAAVAYEPLTGWFGGHDAPLPMGGMVGREIG